MPFGVKKADATKTVPASALLGDYQTLHVKVDVSALTASQVSSTGYLKKNTVMTLNGLPPTTATAVAQVETATAAGTISAGGNINATVTSQKLDGGSKVIPVAVATSDDATAVGGKIRAALAADVDIASYFAVTGATTGIILTSLVPGANDPTLNIALATGTATGLTAAPTSANTTAGVAGSVSEVPCVTVGTVKVAASNSSPDLAAADDVFVACAVTGVLNRDIMEDSLGRVLTAAEIAALNGPNSKLVLSLT